MLPTVEKYRIPRKIKTARRPITPKPKYTNQLGGSPTPGNVRIIRSGPINGTVINHAGKTGGSMTGNGRYGEASNPKAPIVSTIMNQGMVMRNTSK
jgi:hypothetical protein